MKCFKCNQRCFICRG